MTTEVVVLGASTALREVLGITSRANRSGADLHVIGVLDDSPLLQGQVVSGIPVLGTLDKAREIEGVSFIFAIGSLSTQKIRQEIFERIGIPRERYLSLVDPTAVIDDSARIGFGCILHNGCSLGPGVSLGDFVVVAVNSALGPDVAIDDFSLITSFVLLLSNVHVGKHVYIGSKTCVTESIEIGAAARIGAGSLVNRNIPAQSLAVGNPVRLLGPN